MQMLRDWCIFSSHGLIDWLQQSAGDGGDVYCSVQKEQTARTVADKSDGYKFTCDTVRSLCAFICKRTHLHSNYAHVYIQNHKRLLYMYTTGAQTCQPRRTLAKEQNSRKKTDPHAHNSQVCELKPI